MRTYPEKADTLCARMNCEFSGQDIGNHCPLIKNSSGGGIAATLTASYYKGAGTRNGEEREFILIIEPEVCAEKTDTD